MTTPKKAVARSKYGARKVFLDGMLFDSMHEAKRWTELKLIQSAGKISELRRQVSFELIPKQSDEKGKLLERECCYRADFVYIDSHGKTVVEDAKGVRTPEYVIKRKLMLQRYGIHIREV